MGEGHLVSQGGRLARAPPTKRVLSAAGLAVVEDVYHMADGAEGGGDWRQVGQEVMTDRLRNKHQQFEPTTTHSCLKKI